ncbi:hypothetical protein [Yinghuangia soli]|uniref:Uncharacterized protein n=1 Tax=Yinghuangia soli TaxID=2908204 RepID=A0AA41U185_9ACTN|nr:hypothetical protein [Yinghuangia soli]MCF2529290.1 hypothetical protein [Yinghuangia soli]
MGKARRRELRIGAQVWLWSVHHRHPPCQEVLSLRREGSPAVLRLVFAERGGRFASGGYAHSGLVGSADAALNLHEPGVVRRFVDAADALGLPAAGRNETEIDGWPLFDTLTR